LTVRDMPVEQVMTTNVVRVSPTRSINDVVELMYAYRISCVAVCRKKVPIGIISERDLVRYLRLLVCQKRAPRQHAHEVMSAPVISVRRDETIGAALDRRREHRIRRLPVVNEKGELVGMVTQSDLLREISRDASSEC